MGVTIVAEQFLWGVFCDDARHEVNGKVTLVGCYGPDMLIGSFPAVLPKLVVNWHALAPLDKPFTELSVMLMRGDEVLVRMDADQDSIRPLVGATAQGRTRMLIGGIMELHFLEVKEPCVLELKGEYNGGEALIGPKLHIASAPENNPA